MLHTYQYGYRSVGKMTKKRCVNTSTASQAGQSFKTKKVPAEKNASKTTSTNLSANANNTVEKTINSAKAENKQSSTLPTNTVSKRNKAIDGLRALAIIGIVCFHMRPSLLMGGFLGVTLFLVLAGYFCTRSVLRYLNADENAKNAKNIEDNNKNTQGIRHYWEYLLKRVKRIWPPTLGIIAITAPIMWLFSPSLLPKLQADALSGSGFFSNIMYVARKLSYFEQSGLPSPIKHLWYLGLLMQAFVIWPIILAALIKFVRSKLIRMYITAGLAILSSILTFTFAYLFNNYTTPARVYYSLDTRASEFLMGAMLAMYGAWFAKHSFHAWLIHALHLLMGKKNISVSLASSVKLDSNADSSVDNSALTKKSDKAYANNEKVFAEDGIPADLREGLQIDLSDNSVAPDIQELPNNAFNKPKTVFYNPLHAWQRSCIGLLATIVLCYCFVYAEGTSSVFVFGGYTITAAACTLILWSCTQTDNICSRIFAWAPLAYIGRRSFAIYLVHFPVLELFNPANRTTAVSTGEQVLQALVIVALAECLYQLFEKPIQDQQLFKLIRSVSLTLCCIIIVSLIILPVNWQDIAKHRSMQLRPELTAQVEQSSSSNKKPIAFDKTNSKQETKEKAVPKGVQKNVVKQSLPPTPSKYRILFPIAEKVPRNLVTTHTRIDERRNTCSVNLTMVGDSITEGAKPYLMQVMPNAYIDGKVSRQIFHGADEYEKDISVKHAGDVVIFALGTNGPPHDDSVLQHMVDVAKGRPVYFVTTRVPQPWQDATNDSLRKFAATHHNVGIIDWHGLSNGHSEYLTDDGVHLTPIGGPQYAKMIRLAVCGG